MFFLVGINTALRISDLLGSRIDHFLDDHQGIKRRLWIKEQKHGKRQEVVVNDSIQEAFEEYLAAYPEIIGDQNNFIVFTTKANHFKEPIKRGRAWETITIICRDVGLSGIFGTHSLRKTWGYHARMQGVDPVEPALVRLEGLDAMEVAPGKRLWIRAFVFLTSSVNPL